MCLDAFALSVVSNLIALVALCLVILQGREYQKKQRRDKRGRFAKP